MAIAMIGVFFEGYIFYLLILFGILTIIFGTFIIFKIYHRITKHRTGPDSNTCMQKHGDQLTKHGSKMTKRYGFFLGVFRGATPCLKVFILAPLLIVVELPLAFLMILVFASASTVYPIIGFLSANLLKNFGKYDAYVQVAGAIILISIGVFMILNHILFQGGSVGV